MNMDYKVWTSPVVSEEDNKFKDITIEDIKQMHLSLVEHEQKIREDMIKNIASHYNVSEERAIELLQYYNDVIVYQPYIPLTVINADSVIPMTTIKRPELVTTNINIV